jgi:phosphatidate cytidylyltransferase
MDDWRGWDNSIYQIYAGVVVGLLAVVGGLLAYLTRVQNKNLGSIWATYRGWLVMAPIVLAAVALGRFGVIGLVLLLSLAAVYEYARATGLYGQRTLTSVVLLAVVAVAVVSAMDDPLLGTPGWYGLFMALPAYAIAALLVVPIVRNQPEGQLQIVSLAIVGFMYFGWMFGHLGFLANADHAVGYLLYLFFAVSLCDVAAFTCGKLFGRRKLREHISPNKTVGGSVGALGVALALPWLLSFSFPHFDAREKLLAGLIVGIGGQLGDLTISFIKRDMQIKDMGSLIPGHGGILDRIDSLIFTAPLFFHMVRWFHDL